MFAAGRRCAREALGLPERPAGLLGRQPSGAPVWPRGWVGSITHTRWWAAAVTGPTDQFAGLGLDAERRERVPARLLARIATLQERNWIERRPAPRQALARTFLFSAKEAVFKCVHPLLGHPFDFSSITLAEPDADGRFQVGVPFHWLEHLPCGSVLRGRYLLALGHVWVGVALRQATTAEPGTSGHCRRVCAVRKQRRTIA